MKTIILTMAALALLLSPQQASAHCEIPCGVYGDQLRFDLMAEHIDTIEKSIKEIQSLSKAKVTAQQQNQLARWVANKETHAQKLQHIVSQYFLHQRIKPAPQKKALAYQRYVNLLTGAHKLLLGSMKAKQTAELSVVKTLRQNLSSFRSDYFGPKHKAH